MSSPNGQSRYLWTPQKWVASIEPLRAIAALAVIGHHLGQEVWKDYRGLFFPLQLWLGPWGVALFFVLSGFCIHLPQARRLAAEGRLVSPPWREFFLHRAYRLLPAYLAALFAASVVGSFFTTALINPPTVTTFFSHLTFLHTLVGHQDAICGVFWTIAIEVHFYLAYPLYLALRRRFGPGWTVAGLLVVGLGVYYASARIGHESPWNAPVRLFFVVRWNEWALGAWLAEIYTSRQPPRFAAWLFRFPGAMAVWGLLSLAMAYPDFWQVRLFHAQIMRWAMPFVFFLLLGAAVTRPLPRLRVFEWLSSVGTWSYSLYLIHPAAFALLLPVMGVLPVVVQAAVLVAVSILCAWALYAGVERPALRRGRARMQPAATPGLTPS